MKKLFIFVFLFATLVTSAQTGINYKAIVKDGSGNVVANQIVIVQFQILQGAAMTNVYQETHTPSTNAKGMIILNIGTGTTSDIFNDINWGSDDHFLNVQINTGIGLTDMGTTQFMSVPYALNALNAANITGLEAIDEGNGIGWRLKGSDPAHFGNIGEDAVDLSLSTNALGVYGASGDISTAIGSETVASGDVSTAIGSETVASGYISTAMGELAEASGYISTAMGHDTKASGYISTAMGSNTEASGEYATAMGHRTDALGESSTALGYSSEASGSRSTAMGSNTEASGDYSTTMGSSTTASAKYATAMGYSTTASAIYTTAIGRNNVGDGDPLIWIETDPIFEIGNGEGTTSKNAMTVLKNGHVGIGKHTGIGGLLELQTNSTFTHPQLTLIEDNASYARLKFKNTNRNGDDYWDIAGFIGTVVADDRLNFYNSIGGDLMIIKGDGDVTIQGSLTQNSDRRLKRDIETIDFGIAEILKLNPVQYNWKDKENKPYKSLGVLAQEIEEIIPNVVQIGDDEKQTLSVSYTELIPVLIKAIQEQQEIINLQKVEMGALSEENTSQSTKIENLSEAISQIQQLTQRINQLENNQKKVQKEAIAVQME